MAVSGVSTLRCLCVCVWLLSGFRRYRFTNKTTKQSQNMLGLCAPCMLGLEMRVMGCFNVGHSMTQHVLLFDSRATGPNGTQNGTPCGKSRPAPLLKTIAHLSSYLHPIPCTAAVVHQEISVSGKQTCLIVDTSLQFLFGHQPGMGHTGLRSTQFVFCFHHRIDLTASDTWAWRIMRGHTGAHISYVCGRRF